MKNFIKCFSFACLSLLAVALTYRTLEWKDTSGAYVSVTKQLYNTKKDMIDVAFVGSSHVYTSVYPAYLWDQYGISAFDMSLSEQDKFCSYYCLKELLKTQRPKVVCLEMYGLTLDSHKRIGDEYRNMLALKTSLNSIKLLKAAHNSGNEMDYILRWPIVHTRYKELGKYDFRENEINKFSRGAIMGWGLREAGYMSPEVIALKDKIEISEENKKWLDDFILLSKQYDFDLILFVAPDFQSPEQKMISNGAREYAESQGITYIDFTELAGLINFHPDVDMGDLLHCNADGAFKISSYFGQYLDENYDLSDHRGERKYYQWDKDYDYFRHITQENELYLASEDEDYLNVLCESKDLTVVLSLDGEYEGCIDLLAQFGIYEDDCINGGKWIYKNREVKKIMDNNPGESHIYDLNRYDSLKIQCMPQGADSKSNILFGLNQQISVEDGLNIFVYDDLMEKPISKRGMSY